MTKKLSKVILVLGLAFAVLIFIFKVVLFPGCNDNDEALKIAKGLSQEQLTELYIQIERLQSEYVKNKSIDPFPANIEVAGIKAKALNLINHVMVLGGCFDNKVYFQFKGLKDSSRRSNEAQIILRWGEHETAGSEIVWRKK